MQPCFAQRIRQQNLPSYDNKKLHFGFTLGVNKADFILNQKIRTGIPDSILGINTRSDYGFNLGIISDLRLHQYLTLRFVPMLSFQTRNLLYDIHPASATTRSEFMTIEKKIESTLLDFPINLKIRSERLNNFSAYLLVGGKYSLDLASQAKTQDPEIVKLTKHDYSMDIGFGFDFYLIYFKLSTELKFSAGLKDRLLHENTPYSSPINKLASKLWLFSLNFEG